MKKAKLPVGLDTSIVGSGSAGRSPQTPTIASARTAITGIQTTGRAIILKKAGVLEGAEKNAVVMGDCVQRIIPDVISGKGDVSLVELRVTHLPQFAGKVDIIEIPEKFIPPTPIPFVIGVMKWVKNRDLAEDYCNFIISEKGQSFFKKAGFVPALSEEGERLIRKYGANNA